MVIPVQNQILRTKDIRFDAVQDTVPAATSRHGYLMTQPGAGQVPVYRSVVAVLIGTGFEEGPVEVSKRMVPIETQPGAAKPVVGRGKGTPQKGKEQELKDTIEKEREQTQKASSPWLMSIMILGIIVFLLFAAGFVSFLYNIQKLTI